MIATYTLHTSEIDTPAVAVEEIKNQLSKINLRKNTVGIVVCHYDHVEYGVIAALQEALPFLLIGCTSFFKATPETSGLFELTLSVLTSDTVEFSSSYSDETDEYSNTTEKVTQTYAKALSKQDKEPTLILSFISANRPISGDEYLRVLDKASGNVASFGLVDSGEDESGSNTYIICDNKVFSDGLALLLIMGDIKAKTYITSPLADRLLLHSATVTSAEGTLVKEINDQPALTYLQKNGVEIEVAEDIILTSLPFYFHESKSDGYICRLIQSVYEDGSLKFMAEIPEGALLRVGTITSEDIQEEAEHAISKAVEENPDTSFFLIASCVGRFITLGLDITSEIDHVTGYIPEGANYMACYVGGEICPVKKQGVRTNCYHNNSLIVLALS